MRLITLFFSFRGRINRSQFWLAMCTYLVVDFVIETTVLISRGTSFDLSVVAMMSKIFVAQGLLTGMGGALLVVNQGPASIVAILMFISALSVAAKRLHDRDKSAWWLLAFYGATILSLVVFFVVRGNLFPLLFASPAAGYLYSTIVVALEAWYLVELGFLRGTPGPNRYGADPHTLDVIPAAPPA